MNYPSYHDETPKHVKGVIVVKVDVGTIPTEDIIDYMEGVEERITDQRLLDQGWSYTFIPTRNGSETTITFIDLERMVSAGA